MKRILALLMLTAALGATAETVKDLPRPTGYVSDSAQVLSPEEKQQIESQCTLLHQKTGTQIAVVTIHRLDGATAQEFAHGISDAWGVGSKGTDKGIVLLVVTQDRKRWIDVGYGLEGPLNDAKVGDIGRAMVPALKAGHYGEGIKLGVTQISDAILADPGTSTGFTPKTDQGGSLGLIAAFFSGVFLLIVVLFLFLIMRRTRRTALLHAPRSDTGSYVPIFSTSTDSPASSFESSPSPTSGNDSSSTSSSASDFSGFDGGSSGGGGAGGDF